MYKRQSQGSSYVELIKQTQFENDGISAEVQTSDGIYALHFVVPVSEGQQLEVNLKLETDPSQAGRRYQITRYQSVVTREWEEDKDVYKRQLHVQRRTVCYHPPPNYCRGRRNCYAQDCHAF